MTQYYDENAETFFNSTYQVDMDALYAPCLRGLIHLITPLD